MNALPQQMMCEACGSAEVSRDGWAEWDTDGQCWRLGAIFDDAYCHQCDTRTQLIAAPLTIAVFPIRRAA